MKTTNLHFITFNYVNTYIYILYMGVIDEKLPRMLVPKYLGVVTIRRVRE